MYDRELLIMAYLIPCGILITMHYRIMIPYSITMRYCTTVSPHCTALHQQYYVRRNATLKFGIFGIFGIFCVFGCFRATLCSIPPCTLFILFLSLADYSSVQKSGDFRPNQNRLFYFESKTTFSRVDRHPRLIEPEHEHGTPMNAF